MAIPDRGQLILPGSVEEIQGKVLEDIKLGYFRRGQAVPDMGPGTYVDVYSKAFCSQSFVVVANGSSAGDATDVNKATGDDLDAIREARGLPEVAPSGSSGKVIVEIQGGGSANFNDGDQLKSDASGLLFAVSGVQTGIANGDSIDVVAIDTGSETNEAPNSVLKFADPPINVQPIARVDANGLTGGTSEESDDEKRDRIINRLQNPPGGGNVGQLIEVSNNATAAAQFVFVYPALDGGSYAKVVLTGALVTSGAIQSFTREVSSGTVDIVKSALDNEINTAFEIPVQSVEDELVDVALQLKLPTDSTGWLNTSAPWPSLVDADSGRVFVTNALDNLNITISASTATAPIDNVTRIAWFSPTKRAFIMARVTAHSGSAGAWSVTLDTPLNDGTNDVDLGDFISPAAFGRDDYRNTFLDSMNDFGPGENKLVTDIERTKKRAYRQPTIDEGDPGKPTDLTNRQLNDLTQAYPKIRDVAYSHRSLTTPSIPGTIQDAPKILALQHFGIYPLS